MCTGLSSRTGFGLSIKGLVCWLGHEGRVFLRVCDSNCTGRGSMLFSVIDKDRAAI